MKKNINVKVAELLKKSANYAGNAACGTASWWGLHQMEEPKKDRMADDIEEGEDNEKK